MKKITLALFFLTSLHSANAQEQYAFTYTGQAVEEFPLTGKVRQPYEGTCYHHEEWTTENCGYNSSGEYSCSTTHSGSIEPYSCTQYGYFPATGAQAIMPTRVIFSSTLLRAQIPLEVTLDDQGAPVVKARGLLPAGTVMGVKQGKRISLPDESFKHDVLVRLTTNDDLKKNLASQVRLVRLDQKNKRLKLALTGKVALTDNLNIAIRGRARMFRDPAVLLNILGKPEGLATVGGKRLASQLVQTATGVELEVDLINVLESDLGDNLTLAMEQTHTLDAEYVWSNVVGPIKKTLTGTVRVVR